MNSGDWSIIENKRKNDYTMILSKVDDIEIKMNHFTKIIENINNNMNILDNRLNNINIKFDKIILKLDEKNKDELVPRLQNMYWRASNNPVPYNMLFNFVDNIKKKDKNEELKNKNDTEQCD
tara:strand:+ start:301 stop:666 length:366 start_codon:yes stop_codon:yes gene_type:complete